MNAAKMAYEEKCRRNKDGKEYAATVGEIQLALVEAVGAHKQEKRARDLGSFWDRIAEYVCQVIRTTLVVAGLYFGQPDVGGPVGGAGNIVQKNFCMQQ